MKLFDIIKPFRPSKQLDLPLPTDDLVKDFINLSAASTPEVSVNLKPPLSKIKEMAPTTMSYIQSFASNRSSFIPAEYDLAEIGIITDVDCFVSQAFQKKLGLMFKEGFNFVGSDKKITKYHQARMEQIAQASGIPTSELLRRIAYNLISTSNAFLVKVRNEEVSGGKIREDAKGKTLKPVAAYFPAAPETMRVKINVDTGKILEWRQELPDGRTKDFSPDDVIHFTFNKKEGFMFGTPTLIPVIDDIRALRQIEENLELLIYQHLFPLLHYKVGTEAAPAGYDESGRKEIDIAKEAMRYMPAEGALITPERHEVKIIGAESKALRAEGYIEHFKRRVIAGLGISEIDLGVGDCHDDTTETLTQAGWKLHTQIDHTKEKIATFNPETERIEFYLPNYKYTDFYSGKMIRFQSKHLDMLVTPHHKMWICPIDSLKRGNPDWHKEEAQVLYQGKYQNFYVRETAEFTEQDKKLDFYIPAEKAIRGYSPKEIKTNLIDFAKFIGYFVSEGSFDIKSSKEGRYRVNISQKRGLVLNDINNTLQNIGITYKVTFKDKRDVDMANICVRGKTLYRWLEARIGSGAKNKNLPQEVFEWPSIARRALLEALINGDGSRSKKTINQSVYYTTSKQLADDVQILALSLGLRAKVKYAKQSKESFAGPDAFIYKIMISGGGTTHRGFRQVNPSMITEEDYSGTIYCYNVPNHLFMTRRNGKVAIHGNSANRATANTLSRALVDSVKNLQDCLEAQWDQKVIKELLLEGPFGDEALVEENTVKLLFNEIDIENKIEQQKHAIELFKNNGISHSEFRVLLSRDPMAIPEDPHDQDMSKYPDWSQTYWKLIEEPSFLIRAVDEPFSNASIAASEAKGSAITQKTLATSAAEKEKQQQKQAELDKQTKIAVARAKPAPVARKDHFLSQSYIDLEADTIGRVKEGNVDREYIASNIKLWGLEMAKKLTAECVVQLIRGFNEETGGNAHKSAADIQFGRKEIEDRINRFFTRLTDTLISQIKERDISGIHDVFEALSYRLDFAWDLEKRKAKNYGRFLGARKDGFNLLVNSTEDTGCEECQNRAQKPVEIRFASMDDLAPHHAHCICETDFIHQEEEQKNETAEDGTKLERCVLQVKSQLRSKHPGWDDKKVKSSAYAICNASLSKK